MPDPSPAAASSPSLPASNTAVALSLFDPSVDFLPAIVQALNARGYQVAPGNTVDLPSLRALPGQPVGILYLNTHGLFGPVAGVTVTTTEPDGTTTQTTPVIFALATTTPTDATAADMSAADWSALQADLAATPVRLVPGGAQTMTRSGNNPIQGGATPNVFFATRDFFDHYWGPNTFAQNSMVFLNGCLGADTGFQQICAGAGAGLMLGWSLSVVLDDAAQTGGFLFDRMLGANGQNPLIFPEKLPQRPFDWDMVQQNFPLHNSLTGSAFGTSSPPNQSTHQIDESSLMAMISGTPGLLIPCIVAIGVSEITNKLFVNGMFGATQGVVSMLDSVGSNSGGTALTVESWTPNMITCTLPAGNSGAGQACGYVVVAVDTRFSNCVPLTGWSGTVTITASGAPSLQEVITLNCNLRVDAHPYRTDFSSLMSPAAYASVPRLATASQDSTGRYQASGTNVEVDPGGGAITQTVSGGDSFPPLSAATSSNPSGPPVAFDTVLKLDSTITDSFGETHNVQLMLSLPQNAEDPPEYTFELITQQPGQDSTTSQVDAFALCEVFGPQQLLQNATAYDLPDPATQASSNLPFATAVLHVTLSALCPPQISLGEDYLPLQST